VPDRQSDWDIDVEELKRLRDTGEDFFLLDVREPHEVERATLGGSNIPLAQVAGLLDDIPRDRKVVVLCRVGGRSAKAVTALRQLGYDDVWNVNGGILAWSERIDAEVPTY
jgi:adenylyltransferase/sulfurtransferase